LALAAGACAGDRADHPAIGEGSWRTGRGPGLWLGRTGHPGLAIAVEFRQSRRVSAVHLQRQRAQSAFDAAVQLVGAATQAVDPQSRPARYLAEPEGLSGGIRTDRIHLPRLYDSAEQPSGRQKPEDGLRGKSVPILSLSE